MIIKMMHGCGAVIGSRNDHSSRVTKRPIKIRNEKCTKRTYRTCIVEPSRVSLVKITRMAAGRRPGSVVLEVRAEKARRFTWTVWQR